MSNKPVIPIILCGGSGSRLWPLSRKSFPKQYLKLNSSERYSLLQNTYERVSKINNIKSPILICNEEHRFIVAEQMREINIKPNRIILEPFGRNTAPAITLAAKVALEIDDDPLLLVLSSDHEIKKNNQFIKVVKEGIDFAEKNHLVTFGVVPHSPETGYGYIKSENPFDISKLSGNKISEFIEKPSYEKACKFFKDKRYTWNSGMFLFKAKTILNELDKYCPEILEFCSKSLEDSEFDLDFQRLKKENFNKCPNISFDIAVMEKTNQGIVLPLDAEWSDIGSWESVWNTSKKDIDNNVIEGKIFLKDTKNSYLRSESRVIVGIGLENLVVVETDDAILISEKNKTQKVKDMVNVLNEKNIAAGHQHQKIYRPWGNFLSVVEKSRWQVKMIEVKPNGKLSLQMHHHRSEHWVVVKGRAKVEIEGKIDFLTENQSTYIPLGKKHRLSNPGKIPLIIIEIQSGSYVGEDDIVRFEDLYGRLE